MTITDRSPVTGHQSGHRTNKYRTENRAVHAFDELFPVINLFLSYFGHSLSFLKRASLVASGFLSRTRNTEFHQE